MAAGDKINAMAKITIDQVTYMAGRITKNAVIDKKIDNIAINAVRANHYRNIIPTNKEKENHGR